MKEEERFERMMSCAYNPPGGFLCQMGGYPPFDCGFCEDYINATKGEEGENDMGGFGNVRVFVPTNELWEFYVRNWKRCREEMVLIAENTETGYAVYMTDDNGAPMFSVCKGDEQPEYEEHVGSADCEETARKLFMRYLVPFTVVDNDAVISGGTEDAGDHDPGFITPDMKDEMYEREDELDLAIRDFLAVVLQKYDSEAVSAEFEEDFIQEVLNHILEYLTDNHCIQIFRPMVFTDDDGSEVYCKFPYEEYTFGDGGNSK